VLHHQEEKGMSNEYTTSIDFDGFFAASARYLGLSSMQTGARYDRGRGYLNEKMARTKPHEFAHGERSQLHA
jgi:hypothetical protein